MAVRNVLKFDRPHLTAELQTLPISACGAFAAAAATRILPAYVTYCRETGSGDPNQLDAALRCAWDFLEQTIGDKDVLQKHRTKADALTDVPDEPGSEHLVLAQDATAAVTYCLRFLLDNDIRNAVRAAHCSYDAAWQYVVQISIESDFQIATAEETEKCLSHPIMQTELARQQRDLANLKSADPLQLTATIRDLRETSERENVVPLSSS